MKTKLLTMTSLLLALTLMFGGCDMPYGGPTEHTFLQNRENVVKVEICSNAMYGIVREGSQMESLNPIAVLLDEEIDVLWEALLSFPSYEVRYIKHGCGDLLFVVSYANGEQELIGYNLIGIVNSDGTFGGYRNHVFGDAASLTQLFAQYADPTVLAEASMTFRAYYEEETSTS